MRPSLRIRDGALQIGWSILEGLRVFLDCFEVAQNDHHQIVEVVRDAAAELPNGLHLLRSRKLFLRYL